MKPSQQVNRIDHRDFWSIVHWCHNYDKLVLNCLKDLFPTTVEFTFTSELLVPLKVPMFPSDSACRKVDSFVAGVPVAVCSTSNEKSVAAVVRLLGDELADQIRIFAGDVVPKKKPDPAIYNLAAQELNLDPKK